MSRKKIAFLIFSTTLIVVISAYSVWAIITPKWYFSVATDRSTYRLGEAVKIAVSLKNMGFISHSFKSVLSDPVLVTIEHQHAENPTLTEPVWYSPFQRSITEFSLEAAKSLERSFVWNQTNVHFPERKIELGTYLIKAFIPSDDPNSDIYWGYLFEDGTRIDVTAA